MALSQFYEQGNIFNALNSSVMIYEGPNSTVSGVGITHSLVPQRWRNLRPPLSRDAGRWLGLRSHPDDVLPATPATRGRSFTAYNDPCLGTMNGIFGHNGNRHRRRHRQLPPVRIAADH